MQREFCVHLTSDGFKFVIDLQIRAHGYIHYDSFIWTYQLMQYLMSLSLTDTENFFYFIVSPFIVFFTLLLYV